MCKYLEQKSHVLFLEESLPVLEAFLWPLCTYAKKICNKLPYLLNLTSTIKFKNSTPTKPKI